ncbi:MAG: FMN-dependent NADH-azoreductase [Alphaproteobacteria bacterium]|nr:FMN-dependent NADH-azoreductase [Alphaproteobacteria bacterium]
MTHLLVVTSSPKSGGSVSGNLADRFVASIEADANVVRTVRDVGHNPPPHLDETTIGAFFTPEDERTPQQVEAVKLSDKLIAEVEAADIIVIAAPMHNFGVTSALKTWIDHIARAGKTFKYTEAGPVGLLGNRKVYVLGARGGGYSQNSPAHAMDEQEPYLKTVLGFMGLNDVTFIHAEGVAMGEEGLLRANEAVDVAAQALAA